MHQHCAWSLAAHLAAAPEDDRPSLQQARAANVAQVQQLVALGQQAAAACAWVATDLPPLGPALGPDRAMQTTPRSSTRVAPQRG